MITLITPVYIIYINVTHSKRNAKGNATTHLSGGVHSSWLGTVVLDAMPFHAQFQSKFVVVHCDVHVLQAESVC